MLRTHCLLLHTSLGLTPTNQTLTVPCQGRVNTFKFQGDRESHLLLVFKSPTGEDNAGYCNVILSVPSGKFAAVRITPYRTDGSCENMRTSIRLYYRKEGKLAWTNMHPCSKEALVLSEDNTLKFGIYILFTYTAFNVQFFITALDTDGINNLNGTYHTNVSGIVTPYGFTGLTDYAVFLDAWIYLRPPPRHSVLVSYPHFHISAPGGCFDPKLFLLAFKGQDRYRIVWVRCGTLQLPPELYAQDVFLNYRFGTTAIRGYSGFKIRFSFHNAPELPQRLQTSDKTTDSFNCSVPFYAKFHQHLHCNLEKECIHAEDETNCPYFRGPCNPGFLNAGSKCYKYVQTRKIMTWYEASEVCRKQNLTLASFPTLKQQNAFRDNILRFGPTPFKVFLGLRTSDSTLLTMYREAWQWSSGTMAYYIHIDERVFKPTCASFKALSRDIIPTTCGLYQHMQYIFCEAETNALHYKTSIIPLNVSSTLNFGLEQSTRFVTCSEGHAAHDFLSCDHESRCGSEVGVRSCVTSTSSLSELSARTVMILMYVCESQSQTIHYSQVCDHRAQCFDSSDESFCIHRTCREKQCQNKQCVTEAQWCDGMAHCSDGSDEDCPQIVTRSTRPSSSSKSGFHVLLLDGYGKYEYVPQGDEFNVCPPTHFLCANGELCLPVYLRCNGVSDCSDREDEGYCDDVTCPGYYRCRATAVCVHSDHVCDGVFQCPQQDDELFCQLNCPDNCLCQGLAFVCRRPFPVQNYSDLRYLDSSRSGLTPDRIFHNHYLVRLSLSRCRLHTLPVFQLPNLKVLDLSHNIFTNLSMHVFLKLSNLNILSLSGNPIMELVAPLPKTRLANFKSLDMSHTRLRYFDSAMLSNIRNLKTLNLSHGMLEVISDNGFRSLTQIESLDLRGAELKHYPVKMLQSLSSLRYMYSDVYKLCCPDILSGHLRIHNCHTVQDEIASCEDLLRSDMYRLFLWISCFIALIGNAGSFCSRLFVQRKQTLTSFNVFIANLNIADFFMGVYLVIIGSADQVYRGTYLWHDEEWKTCTSCKTAGFFSLLSCEVSAFIICLITIERLLVIRFPFSHLQFQNSSAHLVSGLCWVVGMIFAVLPLLPMTSHWEFYSQSDICIPLPVTRRSFKGHFYSFGILIVFNFLLFVFIAIGQMFIYMSIRGNSMVMEHTKAREATVSRRLLTVVMSDFLCWFPIGLLGLMASNGISIPGEVNVAIAVFVLPLNSALNPFLYTINLLMEKRQKASEQRLLKMLKSKYCGTHM